MVLSEYNISYLPCTTIKAQVLVDIIFEMTKTSLEKTHEKDVRLLHVDGSSTTQGSGADIVITSPQGEDMEFVVIFEFKASNNEANMKHLGWT
ncbi:UNVERIFIED_CONTAM: hypothetical protein Sangu_3029900 [Sesamum angustifolium]|uniref:Uncharacterized protein n=1 Tax=Sesamum angustifolium TaxID=2727405 RepID=A0AAW2KKS1_9LAMI